MKKNQFALIFLTLIVMLAVWYVKSPLAQKDDEPMQGDTSIVTSSRLDAIKNMRDKVNEARSTETASLDAIIASAESTLIQKETALKNKKEISDLTEKEVLLEVLIINMGYQDAFVHSTESGVEVIVVSDTTNEDAVIEIVAAAMSSFDNTDNVIVTFKKVTEI
ncbi:MAG: SpoIIIAH-like family protein [Bacilli bacterium]